MTATLFWSNDPGFYDIIWGETEIGKPLIKVNSDPTQAKRVIEKYKLQAAPKEPWMLQSYQGTSGTYKYIVVVFERLTDDVRAFISKLTA